MTDRVGHLIEKYLAGDIDPDEAQQLNRALADDPQTADELMSAAYMDVHLRETLSGSVLGEAISQQVQLCNQNTSRWLSGRWVVAALLLTAFAGWVFAAYFAVALGEARSNINTLTARVADLERAAASSPIASGKADVPEIHSTRGWLMALPKKDDPDTNGQTLMVGTTLPLDQRIWTCPWGAAEFRYDSGVAISVERNTTVKFNETNDLRRLTLERGIVHVTNSSETEGRPTEIKCDLATVRLIRGQVAVQVDKQRTAVETAVNEVEVLAEDDGVIRKFTVRRGEYLILKPGEKPKVVQGMLRLGLEPPAGKKQQPSNDR